VKETQQQQRGSVVAYVISKKIDSGWNRKKRKRKKEKE
jgi:hypothetical protein